MGSAGQVREDAVRDHAVFSAQREGHERVSSSVCSARGGATLLAMHFIQDSIPGPVLHEGCMLQGIGAFCLTGSTCF